VKTFIDEHREVYGVEPMCRVMQIAPSSYWQHAQRRARPGLRAARATEEYRAISDYSFTVEHKFDPSPVARWVAIGDAAGFLDPIFSSGVHLALSSAQAAVPGILEAMEGGSTQGLQAYAAHMEMGFQVFRAFVQRFYNRDLVQNLFFMENKPAELHGAITRILAGHVWDYTNPVLRLLGVYKPA